MGTRWRPRSASSACWRPASPVRRAQRAHRDLRPAAADRHNHRDRRGLFRHRAGAPARSRRRGQSRPGRRPDRQAPGRHSGEPRRAPRRRARGLDPVPPFGARPRRLCRRLVGAGRLHVRRADPAREVRWPTRSPACSPRSAGCSSPSSPIRARRRRPTATPTRCIRSPPWCSAGVSLFGGAAARSARSSAPSRSAPSAICCSCSISIRCGSRYSWASVLLLAVCLGSFAAAADPQPARSVRVRRDDEPDEAQPQASALPNVRPAASTRRWRRHSAASSSCCSSAASIRRSFLSPEYLLQQLKVASFLGVIATGMMIVILLGQIDLSVPWVVAVGGMMSSRGGGLRAARRGVRHPVRHPLRRRVRPRQRHRRRLSARPLDDLHARRSMPWRRG